MSESAQASASQKAEVKHTRWSDIPTEVLNPLLERQIIVGDQIMVSRLLLRKNCVVPLHSHVNEQVSYIQEGALKFTIDNREIVVRGGEFLCIPPNVPHAAIALEDTWAVDTFTPPREDWINKTDQYLRG